MIPLTLMSLHRPSGEHDKLATTAFSFPDDVPEMLSSTHPHSQPLIPRVPSRHKRKTHLVNQMSWMYVLDGYFAQSLALVS